ncbi:SET domain-containing protein [Paenibacillus pabuli]|uniref:SET domain-containing protein n=1 Tax=Paenibacillus pabuli TaxID=1472 RepID=UPI000780415E|nr:SET domain-containing protein [Paenibacillus pabuli]MEC0124866.1 SET domain-containing protein [Paenibacillus pabuli]
MIEVKQSKLGDGEFNRGVFATVDIPKGQLIHQAPVVPYPNEDHEHVEKTILEDYVFEYGANHTAILLGYGSLINHSYEPNATYDINFDNHTFDFYAYKDIKAGEEVLINYNGEEDNMDPLWFLDDYEERMRELNESNDDSDGNAVDIESSSPGTTDLNK